VGSFAVGALRRQVVAVLAAVTRGGALQAGVVGLCMLAGAGPAFGVFVAFEVAITASISQCFMTRHYKNIEERDTLLFTILFNKKHKYHTASFCHFLCQNII